LSLGCISVDITSIVKRMKRCQFDHVLTTKDGVNRYSGNTDLICKFLSFTFNEIQKENLM
jgi:hypothetical protein